MITIFREILGMIFIALAIVCYIIEVIGLCRFDYVLNRMHAAAIGDSLGALCAFLGAGLLMWDVFAAGKLLVMLVMIYLTSPLSSHLIARVEALTNNHLEAYLDKLITEKHHTLKGDTNGNH